jgi:hypothetical protein
MPSSAVAVSVVKRQTADYPEELREHAQRFHPWTRILHGTVARYAPEEWPAWLVYFLCNKKFV